MVMETRERFHGYGRGPADVRLRAVPMRYFRDANVQMIAAEASESYYATESSYCEFVQEWVMLPP